MLIYDKERHDECRAEETSKGEKSVVDKLVKLSMNFFGRAHPTSNRESKGENFRGRSSGVN